jgi:hypothetical protein
VKHFGGSFPIELPGDLDTITIHPAIPGLRFLTQGIEIGDSPITQTLPREDPDFDLRLIDQLRCVGVWWTVKRSLVHHVRHEA